LNKQETVPSHPKTKSSPPENAPEISQGSTNRGLSVSKPLASGLYLIATPIGNLGDISQRALQTLAACDVIACEDSRATARLLQHYGVHVPRIAYHEHSSPTVREAILLRLAEGQRVGLVSDAGTPLISDPGFKLVREAIAQGAHVSALPGPSAPLMALILSGLPSDRFFFQGFLPPKGAARRSLLASLAGIEATLIFFESARRLPQCLDDMAQMLGGRSAAVARELTKLFEEVRRDTLPALRDHYRTAGPPKGEVVIVVGPPIIGAPDAAGQEGELENQLREALTKFRLKEAVAQVAAITGLPRKQVYARALSLTGKTNA
jgi:16S rRNA (cytidine1402-2'-O)-methyltransferase